MATYTLNVTNRIKVTMWLSAHFEECKKLTAVELAIIATTDLGFPVGSNAVGVMRRSMFPELKRSKKEAVEDDLTFALVGLSELRSEVKELKRQIANIYTQIGQLPI